MPKSQIVAWVADYLRLPDSVVRVVHKEDGGKTETELEYRLGWALTRLKKVGAADNPRLGYWVVTEFGKTIQDELRLRELSDAYLRQLQFNRDPRATASSGSKPVALRRRGQEQRTIRRHSGFSGPGNMSTTKKTQAEWVLDAVRMLADAGVAEQSLDRIEHAARALGWNGNSRSIRSAIWVAGRDGYLEVVGHGCYKLPDSGRKPGGPSSGQSAGDPARDVPPALAAGYSTERALTGEGALTDCVRKLSDMVAELKKAVDDLARGGSR